MKNKVKINSHFGIGVRFYVEKLQKDIIKEKYEFENLVLDSGLDGLDSLPGASGATNLTRYCNVGSGNSEPLVTQTSLDSILGTKDFGVGKGNVTGQFATGLPVFIQYEKIFLFDIGTLVGNIREVGLSTSTGIYFNRALIKDEFGNPTTIVMEADQQLRVTARIRCYYDLSFDESEVKTFLFDGVSHTTTRRPHAYLLRSWTSLSYQGPFANPLGTSFRISINSTGITSVQATSINLQAYVPGSFERIGSFIWNAVSYTGNIPAIYVGTHTSVDTNVAHCRIEIDPVIPKSNTEEVTFQIKRTWGRYVAP